MRPFARPAFPQLAALAFLSVLAASACAGTPAAAPAGDYRPPVLSEAPPPAYPEAALRPERTLTKQVVVRLQIDENGVPREVAIRRSGGPLFDLPALANAKRWRFQPALLDGKPVPAVVEATVEFAGSELPGKPTLAVVPPPSARRLGPAGHQVSARPQPAARRDW